MTQPKVWTREDILAWEIRHEQGESYASIARTVGRCSQRIIVLIQREQRTTRRIQWVLRARLTRCTCVKRACPCSQGLCQGAECCVWSYELAKLAYRHLEAP